jgi:hypothetical protein
MNDGSCSVFRREAMENQNCGCTCQPEITRETIERLRRGEMDSCALVQQILVNSIDFARPARELPWEKPWSFPADYTTKEVGRGTGQGLTIARSVVVDKHGGRIEFISQVGKGTTFYIRLPAEQAE